MNRYFTELTLRLIACVILVIIAAVGYSLVANMHIHVTPTGHVFVHSHPHDEQDNRGQGQHSHSALDRLCLAHISKIFHSFLVLIFFILLGTVWLSLLKSDGQDFIARLTHYSRTFGRAPPFSPSY